MEGEGAGISYLGTDVIIHWEGRTAEACWMVVSLTYKELLQVSKLPFLFTVVWEKAAFSVHCSVGEI